MMTTSFEIAVPVGYVLHVEVIESMMPSRHLMNIMPEDGKPHALHGESGTKAMVLSMKHERMVELRASHDAHEHHHRMSMHIHENPAGGWDMEMKNVRDEVAHIHVSLMTPESCGLVGHESMVA